jgi:hypothetical protein
LDLKESKSQETGENFVVRNFIICTPRKCRTMGIARRVNAKGAYPDRSLPTRPSVIHVGTEEEKYIQSSGGKIRRNGTTKRKKVKLSLYRPWRALGLREVEAPTFSDIPVIDSGKVVSPTCWPPFTHPQEDSWYSFLLKAESTPRP